ncbi:putative pre-mrna splicing factor cwc24 protein [Zymoseptoria brevis]|uniref:Pre-mRNA-splicing factor CWC24 n=1 Tax=Zymoseptoria brevis TaxID=1047168 RepID=A0A0F4GTC8_9PEZI|nr:putative pre-mrna splicing factor cwc24 protein [Zymoseptoria brevis]
MADVAAPVFKKRTNKANLRKRPATPPPEDQSASDTDYTDDEGGVRVKRRKREGVTTSNTGPRRAQDLSKSTAFAADRTTTLSANDDATKASNWYTDAALAAKDAGANLKPGKDAAATAIEREQGTYQGTAQYSTFISKNPDARQMGPVKAPTNVRTITVTDFAPDVCKDYKQTGFCGFGDSCKFLHAREDYKQGWQLDKEWESVGSKKKKAGADGKGGDDDMDEEEKMLEKIPFACVICKEGYKNPVVTKCGHYFCEKCAMGRYMKEKKKSCAACGADTNGSFGVARKLKDLLEKKKKRKKERKAKMREAGEEVSEDED